MLCTESCGEPHHVGPCDALSPAAVPAAQRTKPYLGETGPPHVLPLGTRGVRQGGKGAVPPSPCAPWPRGLCLGVEGELLRPLGLGVSPGRAAP